MKCTIPSGDPVIDKFEDAELDLLIYKEKQICYANSFFLKERWVT